VVSYTCRFGFILGSWVVVVVVFASCLVVFFSAFIFGF